MAKAVAALPLLGLLLFVFQVSHAITCLPGYAACGEACYHPDQYDCFNGNDLCPKGYRRCGLACYSPAEYHCVNGQLVFGAEGPGTGNTVAPATQNPATQQPLPTYPASGDYKLVWADEFSGTKLNPNNWDIEINCWGGGNGEKQCYVDHPDTIFVNNGLLHIRATRVQGNYVLSKDELARCTNNNENSCNWYQPVKSGRLRTLQSATGSWLYGRFLVRAKLPRGNYLWPAIWMLPTDNVYGGWANSGEIDIMEARGQVSDKIGHALHYGGGWPNNVYIAHDVTQTNIIDDFHVYGVEWERDYVRFLVDDKLTWEVDLRKNWWSGRGPNPYNNIRQPWDQRFHFILNLAVGGGAYFSGYPPFNPDSDPSTWSRAEMTVDWVRVYQR